MSKSEEDLSFHPYEKSTAELEAETARLKIREENETTRILDENRRDADRRVRRSETLRGTGVGLAVLSVLAGIGWLIWNGTSGPSGTPSENDREQACYDNGGGWVPEDLLSSASEGLCVYPPGRGEDG